MTPGSVPAFFALLLVPGDWEHVSTSGLQLYFGLCQQPLLFNLM